MDDDALLREARIARELAGLAEEARTRVVLGALAMASVEKPRRRGPSADAWAAIGATAVAVASLVLTVDQARTQRKQLAAAVWPSLRVVYSNFEDAEHPAYRLSLVNGGVGPARIQAFSVLWRGLPVSHVNDWSQQACPSMAHGWVFGTQTGTLLSPGAQATVVQHPRAEQGGADDRCVEQAMMGPLDVRVCYCSALDDCWTVSMTQPEPAAVRDCGEARKMVQFERE